MAIVTVNFNTPGTYYWTCPVDIWDLVPSDDTNFMECYGGGGPGAGRTTNGISGGGAGGAYAKLTGSAAFRYGRVYTIVVAAAVNGTTGTGPSGNSSIISTSESGEICKATGGGPGTSTTGGSNSTTGSVGTIIRAGGLGAGPGSPYSGAGGGGGGSTSAGGNASNPNGGTSGGGQAGVGGNSQTDDGTSNGSPGTAAGGGGGGASRLSTGSPTGGQGAQGYVKITYDDKYLGRNVSKHHQLLIGQ